MASLAARVVSNIKAASRLSLADLWRQQAEGWRAYGPIIERLAAMHLIAMASFFATVPALGAEVCPVHGPEEKLQILAAAPSCQESVRLFTLCAMGASLDGRLAVPVKENCEKRFISRLTAERRKTYEAELEACNAKYAQRQGTINRSANAFCRVDVISKYAGRD
jgi:hypothetical protein